MSDSKKLVLLDTDIGSDIDDLIALAYLLKQPRCELLGVTTVTGEPQVRAQLADAVCQAFGRKEVPIYSGAGQPLILPQEQKEVPQRTVLDKWPHREKFAPNVAVDFLRQTIRSRPGEITLLSIGPITNLGLLFALDPEIPSLLKQYVLMGGAYADRAFVYGPSEFNARCDAHATAIVFAANAPGTRAIGLDVTTRCRFPTKEFITRFSKGPLNIVGQATQAWYDRYNHPPEVTFHDPLAAVCIFEPDLCKYQTGQVEVELQSDRLHGLTYFNPRAEKKPHEIAVEVDAATFFKHYFDVVEA